MPKWLDRLKDSRVRNLLILGILIVIVIIIFIYLAIRKPTPATTGADTTKTTQIPRIASVPGGTTTEKYQQLLEAENKKRAEQAQKAGTSAVPTIIGARTKDSLALSESFGIEGNIGECACNRTCIPGLDPATAKRLIAQVESQPDQALYLLKKTPCLGKAICNQKPELALKLMKESEDATQIFLDECPDIVNTDGFKQLLLDDPAFAKRMALNHPDILKKIMRSDSAFANKFAKVHPEIVKQLMLSDPQFAADMIKNNPAMVKQLMLDDPDFARALAQNNPALVKAMMDADPDFAKALRAKVPGIDGILEKQLGTAVSPEDQRLKAYEDARRRAQLAADEAQRQAMLSDQQQKQMQTLLSAMDGQAKAIFQAWNDIPLQVFVRGDLATKKAVAVAGGPGGPGETVITTGAVVSKKVLIKAGTVYLASLDTSINSDEPGPVLATIIAGPFKGSKLLGTMSTTAIAGGASPERVTLTFANMSIPAKESSISIQATAIDPDTARTALATDVDYHYILRYGALFASSFMTGLATAITSQGTVQTTAANGGSTTTTTPKLSTKDQILAALGQVGQAWSAAVSPLTNRPYTITVDSGTSLGILFTADVADTN